MSKNKLETVKIKSIGKKKVKISWSKKAMKKAKNYYYIVEYGSSSHKIFKLGKKGSIVLKSNDFKKGKKVSFNVEVALKKKGAWSDGQVVTCFASQKVKMK